MHLFGILRADFSRLNSPSLPATASHVFPSQCQFGYFAVCSVIRPCAGRSDTTSPPPAYAPQKGSRDIRVTFMPNPADASDPGDLNRRAVAALDTLSGEALIKYLLALTGGKAEPEAALTVSGRSGRTYIAFGSVFLFRVRK